MKNISKNLRRQAEDIRAERRGERDSEIKQAQEGTGGGMKDNMARSIASDKNDPNNFPEDNGLRLCTECGEDIKIDLFNAKEAEVEEFDNCYAHLKTIEELQEYAFGKVREIVGLKAEYKRYFEWKDKRIFALEQERDSLQRDYNEVCKIARGELK